MFSATFTDTDVLSTPEARLGAVHTFNAENVRDEDLEYAVDNGVQNYPLVVNKYPGVSGEATLELYWVDDSEKTLLHAIVVETP